MINFNMVSYSKPIKSNSSHPSLSFSNEKYLKENNLTNLFYYPNDPILKEILDKALLNWKFLNVTGYKSPSFDEMDDDVLSRMFAFISFNYSSAFDFNNADKLEYTIHTLE